MSRRQQPFLSPQLAPVADSARQYMQSAWGISNSQIRFEEELDGDITPSPTLQAPSHDRHIICVEVSRRAFPGHLKGVIADCIQRGLPVKMYVAVPEHRLPPEDLRQARDFGVGLLLVGAACKETLPALSLSLVGVRDPESDKWPLRYRPLIADAYNTFKNGDPAKGCSLVFDLIEQLSRKLCVRAAKKSWWRNLPASASCPDASKGGVPLEQIARFLYDYFNPTTAGTPSLNKAVLGAVVGAVGQRNAVSHPPKTLKERKKLDARARTLFEYAVDTLKDLVTATAPLRLPVA